MEHIDDHVKRPRHLNLIHNELVRHYPGKIIEVHDLGGHLTVEFEVHDGHESIARFQVAGAVLVDSRPDEAIIGELERAIQIAPPGERGYVFLGTGIAGGLRADAYKAKRRSGPYSALY